MCVHRNICVRKTGPELTSVANLPFFFFAQGRRAELISVPILLYFMWDAPTAWLDDQSRSAPRIRTYELWAAEAEHANITTTPPGQPPHTYFLFLRKISPELTSATNLPLFAEEDWP